MGFSKVFHLAGMGTEGGVGGFWSIGWRVIFNEGLLDHGEGGGL